MHFRLSAVGQCSQTATVCIQHVPEVAIWHPLSGQGIKLRGSSHG